MKYLALWLGMLALFIGLPACSSERGWGVELVAEQDGFPFVVPLISDTIAGSATYVGNDEYISATHLFRRGEDPALILPGGSPKRPWITANLGRELVRIAVANNTPWLAEPTLDLSYQPTIGERITLVGMQYEDTHLRGQVMYRATVIPAPSDIPLSCRGRRSFCVSAPGLHGPGSSGGAAIVEGARDVIVGFIVMGKDDGTVLILQE